MGLQRVGHDWETELNWMLFDSIHTLSLFITESFSSLNFFKLSFYSILAYSWFWRRDRLPTPGFLGLSGGSDGKESTYNVGDLGSVPGLGRSPRGGHGNPLQYSCLENPQGQKRLAATVHGAQRVGHNWGNLVSTWGLVRTWGLNALCS